MSNSSHRSPETANELTKAMVRLRARLRAESAPNEMPWTWSQLTTLVRIIEDGPTTTTALANAEHVRRQSMAETVAALREDGLVSTDQDPNDGRKTLITTTDKGKKLGRAIPAAREAWLDEAIRTNLDPKEQQTLLEAAAIMNRLADS